MSKIIVSRRLPFVTVTLSANGQTLTLDQILVDTGSFASVFRTDDLAKLDVRPQGSDRLIEVFGIGGSEHVVQTQIDQLQVGDLSLRPAVIQMGRVDYGFNINGILGFDFLQRTGAAIDLKILELRKA